MLSASAEVVAVPTGTEALLEISNTLFDLCCLDINLPDMSGMDIMRRIKEIAPTTKIIIMTGADVTPPMLRDIQKHCALLLSKPFDLFKVKTFVDSVLELGKPAYRDDTVLIRNYKAFEYWLMNDQRRHERKPVIKRIMYSAVFRGQEQKQEADIIDISESGLCLRTKQQLTPGQLVRLVNSENIQETVECLGTVRWSMTSGSDGFHLTGIQFRTSAGQHPVL